jgi:hypothetical protein
MPSASFRLKQLPFDDVDGYEDWYLVADWQGFGKLAEVAVDSRHRDAHDRAARNAAKGWGGVYRLLRGDFTPPRLARWVEKSPGATYETFLRSLPTSTIWQRQLVLGPAPEFCLAESALDLAEGEADARRAL